jgi:dolichol-phosphate mannosyltransferase
MGLDLSWEIVLIDDASPEIATWEAVQAWAAAEKRVKGLRLAVNLNSQGAILVGLQHCQGRMAVMMDSDLQDPPELIPALVKAAQEGNEVVYGFCQSRQEGVIMRIARFGFYQLLSFLHGRKYPRAGNFCLFNTNALQAAQKLTSIPFWRTWRMTVGGQQTGVPFVRPPRFAGKSHNHLLSNIRWALLAFISMPNFIAEYILILGTLIIGVITFFHPMVWPIMLLAEFFLAVQYLILRYLATMHERPRPPWPLIDKINLFEN